jgi:hypothetical protein
MAKKKKTSSCNSSVMRAPRGKASLDLWVGKDQFVASGVSTDPGMLWNQPRKGAARQSGEERSLKANHPIV